MAHNFTFPACVMLFVFRIAGVASYIPYPGASLEARTIVPAILLLAFYTGASSSLDICCWLREFV